MNQQIKDLEMSIDALMSKIKVRHSQSRNHFKCHSVLYRRNMFLLADVIVRALKSNHCAVKMIFNMNRAN